jgi:hypothetical protein
MKYFKKNWSNKLQLEVLTLAENIVKKLAFKIFDAKLKLFSLRSVTNNYAPAPSTVLLRRCLLNRLLQTQTSATTILKMWTH